SCQPPAHYPGLPSLLVSYGVANVVFFRAYGDRSLGSQRNGSRGPTLADGVWRSDCGLRGAGRSFRRVLADYHSEVAAHRLARPGPAPRFFVNALIATNLANTSASRCNR